MPRYIAWLRAVNVSGSRIIKMEELRKHFAIPGFTNIASYIQSGNILFDAKATERAKLEAKIEKMLLKALGFEVEVLLRSIDEIKDVVKKDPFKKQRKETDKYYVVFLKTQPEKELIKKLEALSCDTDNFRVIGDELYWLCSPDAGASIVKSAFFEKNLKVFTTNRNWNTVNKVLEL
jgi:uncharacterized protein (DUF1697 family)